MRELDFVAPFREGRLEEFEATLILFCGLHRHKQIDLAKRLKLRNRVVSNFSQFLLFVKCSLNESVLNFIDFSGVHSFNMVTSLIHLLRPSFLASFSLWEKNLFRRFMVFMKVQLPLRLLRLLQVLNFVIL